MKKKCYILALVSFVLAIAIFVFTYFFFHYLGSEGVFTSVFHEEPVKPYVTELLGEFGVMFLFTGTISLLIGKIFFSKKDNK
ncbi:MAG: hypothetical protein E7228_04435 [Clostridiales bacterium]|nr:hypothetical protein [Clostridiales bacterium]